MKRLITVSDDTYVTKRVDSWCKNHNKDYLTSEADLEDLSRRYDKHIGRALAVANLLAFSTLIFLGSWIYARPEQQTANNFWPTLFLTVMIWIVIRYGLGSSGKHRELFNSFRQFHHEWKQLEELHRKAEDGSYYLKSLGEEIATAERRQDVSAKNRLMKTFKRNHRILLHFDIVKDEDYGVFIPNHKNRIDVTIPVDWSKVKS